jgi:hypothetical protein
MRDDEHEYHPTVETLREYVPPELHKIQRVLFCDSPE